MSSAMPVLVAVIATSVVVGGAAYMVGSYSGEVDQDACYSDTLELIRSFEQHADAEQIKGLMEKLSRADYETNCRKVMEAVAEYAKAQGESRAP
ncbi:MAG: hypothetical protein HY067_09145 [Betaproteobacteria bacterium]|nr:hypothetical protein [Betaproteobacteria bacterium]